ncbi:hypothetical protein P153DRAFT_34700 [Dothidotthia symphoricarpi CBS 119687]|uniref:Subtelomeric hrmA-associated cluster protein AFUB-079030/YDR124W-like helical bundle domain-containing protein n=1 Tax=Dothidotthia symphoricarpi CBS 119687 TaxID=1392245 RepID=A0A6A6AAY6_9PLEO|nr:uncharacterized protein P153DRAFT_34700 [Dothidotthia symphoricarpi CBS 119687]KAF2128315.1 hypothetical protein P153DRAFT_34700 [Dothidotthia symphoricarpi CBS 119687]
MAKFKAAGPLGVSKDRSLGPSGHWMDAQINDFGEDPFVLTEDGDFSSESKHTPTETMIKDVVQCNEIALPTPIASRMPLGKIITADGREHAVYQPIPGFEHLFKPQQQHFQGIEDSRKTTPAPRRPIKTQTTSQVLSHNTLNDHSHNINQEQDASDESTHKSTTKNLSSPRNPKSKSLKRSRSVADETSRPRPVVRDESEEEDDSQNLIATSEESYTFYIGDFEKLKQFLRRRFDELTMKPLRGIITQWIKQLEPRRLGAYGRYHKKLPSEEADEMTPPWWPRHVHYNEPSHLAKTDLLTLAVDVMLLHRRIDEVKRKGSWIAKLRQVALYNIETTPSEHFSSSKGSNFSDLMRDRALKSILPSLFDVASSYEEHLAMYDLYEGADGTDPGTGKYHTWQPISRPPRRPARMKRRRVDRASPMLRTESSNNASADDTEPDDTMVNMSRRASSTQSITIKAGTCTPPIQSNVASPQQQPWKVGSPVAVAAQPVSAPSQPQQNYYLTGPMPTPSSSFDDVKGGNHTIPSQHETYPRSTMTSFSQPMQYTSSHANYNTHLYQPLTSTSSFSHSAPSSFAPLPAPDLVNSFQMAMFDGPYSTQVHQASFLPPIGQSNTHGYPYEYDTMFTPTTMNMTVSPTDVHTGFHGLPMDYNTNGRGSLHH